MGEVESKVATRGPNPSSPTLVKPVPATTGSSAMHFPLGVVAHQTPEHFFVPLLWSQPDDTF